MRYVRSVFRANLGSLPYVRGDFEFEMAMMRYIHFEVLREIYEDYGLKL